MVRLKDGSSARRMGYSFMKFARVEEVQEDLGGEKRWEVGGEDLKT